MLNFQQAKDLLNDPTLSDEEIEKIRIGFRDLAEIIFDKFIEERSRKKNNTKK